MKRICSSCRRLFFGFLLTFKYKGRNVAAIIKSVPRMSNSTWLLEADSTSLFTGLCHLLDQVRDLNVLGELRQWRAMYNPSEGIVMRVKVSDATRANGNTIRLMVKVKYLAKENGKAPESRYSNGGGPEDPEAPQKNDDMPSTSNGANGAN